LWIWRERNITGTLLSWLLGNLPSTQSAASTLSKLDASITTLPVNRFFTGLIFAIVFSALPAFGQIDPEKRQLIQIGYNQPIEGKAPISGYAFYYRNEPGFIRTNMTLRLSVAPVYVDSELGFRGEEETDFAMGAAGGGYADSYNEIRSGQWMEEESFLGHGGEVSFSVYHRVNPDQIMPLNLILRASPHYSSYHRDSDTDDDFELPKDRLSMNIRTGARLGGMEPLIFPRLGAELSAWYEGQFRTDNGTYGYGDRRVEESSHLFWARALFIYTLPEVKHNMGLNLTLGTSADADRFSAYRLGGFLPLASEFPLIVPGYYHQELSAKRFILLSGQYTLPLDSKQRWNITAVASTAKLTYITPLEQPGRWHSGAGIALGYKSPREIFRVIVGYSYGFDAIRSHGRGAQSIGLLVQWDLEARHRTPRPVFDLDSPEKSRGLFEILR
jgi:hypothetical protein